MSTLPSVPSISHLSAELQRIIGPLKDIANRPFAEVEQTINQITEITSPYDRGSTDLTIPPNPTGLTATGVWSKVILTWDLPTYDNHSRTEVYRGTDGIFGNAISIGVSSGSTYVDSTPQPGVTYYYWIVNVSLADISSAGANGPQSTSIVPVEYIEFDSSLIPVKIHSDVSLPAPGNAGDIIFWTQDNTLYIYDGTKWSADIDPADLSGTLAGDRIDSGAISTINLTGNVITSANAALGTGAITVGKFANLAVDNGNIVDGAIKTANIANGAIREADIANSTIEAATIDTGAVTSAKINSLNVFNLSGYVNTVVPFADSTWFGPVWVSGTEYFLAGPFTLPGSPHPTQPHMPTFMMTIGLDGDVNTDSFLITIKDGAGQVLFTQYHRRAGYHVWGDMIFSLPYTMNATEFNVYGKIAGDGNPAYYLGCHGILIGTM